MKRIIWPDMLFVLGLLLYLGVGFITKMAISKVAAVEGFAGMAVELEANPIARAAMNIKYGFVVLQWGTIALLSGTYYMIRRNWSRSAGADKELKYNMLAMMSISLFMLFLQNMMNDLPILIGIMSGGV